MTEIARTATAFLATVACACATNGQAGAGTQGDPYRSARTAMVDLIAARGVRDSATLEAMRLVPRHEFVPVENRALAYRDHPLPIGYDQTISQPYIVALMTEALELRPGMRVLEVGTGSGYQAAVLAAMGMEVFTIELLEPLATSARARLARLGFDRVTVRHGDGYLGWKEAAPFDAVIVTAAPEEIPPALTAQLRPGGRLVIPVGPAGAVQSLMLVSKANDGTLATTVLLPVRFVPMKEGPP
ncbi:MAG: protein-L-isoaspartate(D-aspartate) O-methyltransferase [Gemmatimonadales bacterium]|nr:protein-L-isoaspartate(D-aspartate) O-methyltransferase [Gemmatimonadales bacterium]